MQIAITTWAGRVSPLFDSARSATLLSVNAGLAGQPRELPLTETSALHKARSLAEQGIDILVCGAISRQAVALLTSQGVLVYPWVGGTVDRVLQTLLRGESPQPSLALPGCGGRRCQRRRRGGRGRGPKQEEN
jgi:predicted Fe-Mo cluster-binding NifX family protein